MCIRDRAQNSKWLHFGLGASDKISRVTVAWPGGETQSYDGVQADQRYRLVCGDRAVKSERPRTIEWPTPLPEIEVQGTGGGQANTPSRLPVPALPFLQMDGKSARVAPGKSERLILVNLWASWCAPCAQELKEFASEKSRLEKAGLDIVALSLDGVGKRAGDTKAAEKFMSKLGNPFSSGIATPETLQKISILHDQIYEKRSAVALPTSLLIDQDGRLAGYYEGGMDVETLMKRVELARLNDPQTAMTQSLPFAGRWLARPLGFLLTEYGDALMKNGYAGDAASIWNRFDRDFKLDPKSATFAVKLGIAMEQKGRMDQAIKFYEQAVSLKPNNASARVSLATKYMQVKRFPEAAGSFQAALKLDPSLVDARYNLAVLLSRSGKNEEALAEFRSVVKDVPDHALAHANIAAMMMKSQNLTASIEHLKLALKAKPEFTAVRLQLAKLLEASGQTQEAAEQYELLLKQNPGLAPAVEGLKKLRAKRDEGK